MFYPRRQRDGAFPKYPLQCNWVKWNGCWPKLENISIALNILYGILSFLSMFSFTTTCYFQMVYFVENFGGNIVDTTDSMASTFFGLMSLFRFISLHLYRNHFKILIKMFAEEIWMEGWVCDCYSLFQFELFQFSRY